MNLRKAISSKKGLAMAGPAILVIAVGLSIWIHGRNDTSFQTESKCSDYPGGLPVLPDNITTFTDKASGVVVGTILNPEVYDLPWSNDNPSPRLRVTDVFKGSALRKGDVLRLCGRTGSIDFTGDNHTVLVFLDGKNQGLWIPLQGYIGIIPQSRDGRFRQDWGDGSKTSATINELRKDN